MSNFKLYSHLAISVTDLEMANEFASYTLKKKMDYKPWKKGDLFLIQTAFRKSMVISYWRPFSIDKWRNTLNDFIKFSPKQKKLHKKICDLRNGLYAHSDPRQYLIQHPTVNKFRFETIHSFNDFSIKEIKELQRMIHKLIKTFQKEKDVLEKELLKSTRT